MKCRPATFAWLFLFVLLIPAGSTRADALNDQRTFFVSSQYDADGASSRAATLRFVSNRAYWYVSDNYWNGVGDAGQSQMMSFITYAASEFDNRIYPKETSLFGPEPNPGIDGDTRITILVTRLKSNIGGFFDNTNEYPRTDFPASNEREMVIIQIPDFSDYSRSLSFVAHEFQHMISFQQKEAIRQVTEDTWLNELRSEYAITAVGYNDPFETSNLQRRITVFLQRPSDSLTEWNNTPTDYGIIAAFGEYVEGRFPGMVLARTIQTSSVGVAAFNDALAQAGSVLRFADVFGDWLVASFLNDGRSSAFYRYARPELQTLRVTPTQTISRMNNEDVTYTIATIIKDWESRWYEIDNLSVGSRNVLQISFGSPSLPSFSVPYIIYHADGSASVNTFYPRNTQPALYISNLGSDAVKVVLMPFKGEKLFGFGAFEPGTSLSISLQRVDQALTVPVPTPTSVPSAPPVPSSVHPEDFGLREGDFIRAEGDIDVYIINQFGYKRLVVNPQICLLYGHLGARGCFSAVKTVSPAVRDAFKTSWYVTNGETKDGRLYQMNLASDDAATLHDTGAMVYNFSESAFDPLSVFQINTSELRLYPRS